MNKYSIERLNDNYPNRNEMDISDLSDLENLPPEIIVGVFDKLPVDNLIRLLTINKNIYENIRPFFEKKIKAYITLMKERVDRLNDISALFDGPLIVNVEDSFALESDDDILINILINIMNREHPDGYDDNELDEKFEILNKQWNYLFGLLDETLFYDSVIVEYTINRKLLEFSKTVKFIIPLERGKDGITYADILKFFLAIDDNVGYENTPLNGYIFEFVNFTNDLQPKLRVIYNSNNEN